jgi:hypothetical protein
MTSTAVELSHLCIIFTEVADKHEDDERHNADPETGPVVCVETCHQSSYQQEENAAWSQNRTNEQDKLRGRKGECLFCKNSYIGTPHFESNFSHRKNLGELRGFGISQQRTNQSLLLMHHL